MRTLPGTSQALCIGVCEDDSKLRSLLSRELRAEGFCVRAVATGQEAIEVFTAAPPHALVLDLGLPDADGRDVCRALRSHGLGVPVLFLTGRDAMTDRLAGFHAGGDDYVVKPFDLAELLVRLRALLRRFTALDAPVPGLRLDPASHAVRLDGRSEVLTPTEFRLLGALAARPGTVLRRRELVATAWPDGAIVHDNTLDAFVGRLRKKLCALGSPEQIVTTRGVGYSLR